MKKFLLPILIILVIATMSLVPRASANETYAIVNVIEKPSRLIIRTTIDNQPSTAVNLKLNHVDNQDIVEFSPVLRQLKRLNDMGYELVNGSVAVFSERNRLYHSFILRKRNS